jgi:hypothetical protein
LLISSVIDIDGLLLRRFAGEPVGQLFDGSHVA